MTFVGGQPSNGIQSSTEETRVWHKRPSVALIDFVNSVYVNK